MNDMGLYALQFADIERAKTVLFEAFRNDPFFEYMFGPRHNEERIVKSIHAFTVTLGIRYGAVYAPSEAIEGAAIWLPPGKTKITIWRSITSGVLKLRGTLASDYRETVSFARRMLRYTNYSDSLHKKHAALPHWYLLAIGIGDNYRGKGYASRLMLPMIAEFDHDRTPCYLETHNVSNIELYNHFGFSVVEEGTLPGSDKKHWAMMRNPRV